MVTIEAPPQTANAPRLALVTAFERTIPTTPSLADIGALLGFLANVFEAALPYVSPHDIPHATAADAIAPVTWTATASLITGGYTGLRAFSLDGRATGLDIPAALSGWIRSLTTAESEGRKLIIGGGYGFLRSWHIDGSLATLDARLPHSSWILSLLTLSFDDAQIVVSGDQRGGLVSWTLEGSPGPLSVPNAHANAITALATPAHTDQPLVISGALDGAIYSWQLDGQRGPISLPAAHPSGVTCLASIGREAGFTVVSGGLDGRLRRWSPAGGLLGDWVAHEGGTMALLGIELEGRSMILSGGMDGAIRSWTVDGQAASFHVSKAHAGGVRALTCVSYEDKPLIISAGADGVVRQWRLDSSRIAPVPRPPVLPLPFSLAGSPATDLKVVRLAFASPLEVMVQFPSLLVSVPSAFGFVLYAVKRLAGFDLEIQTYRTNRRAELLEAQQECERLEALAAEGKELAQPLIETAPNGWTLSEASVVEADD